MRVEELRKNINNLTDRDKVFALSLLSAHERGSVTTKQATWIDIMAQRAIDNAPVAFPRIYKLLRHAATQGVTKVKIRLRGVHIGYSATHDMAYINDPVRTFVSKRDGKERKVTYATIDSRGIFRVSQFTDAKLVPKIREELLAFEVDPHKAAGVEGHATGSCCFCGRHLDTKESVAAGYGPVCANKYGLPWGEDGTTNRDNVFNAVMTQ